MRWRGRRQSSNIEDQRGSGGLSGGLGRGGGFRIPVGGTRTGGFSLSTIVILVVLFFVLRACGIDPLAMLEEGGVPGQTQVQPSQPGGTQTAQPSDEMGQFVATVLAETEDVWSGIFQAEGQTYQKPTLVMFSDQVRSACGFA